MRQSAPPLHFDILEARANTFPLRLDILETDDAEILHWKPWGTFERQNQGVGGHDRSVGHGTRQWIIAQSCLRGKILLVIETFVESMTRTLEAHYKEYAPRN